MRLGVARISLYVPDDLKARMDQVDLNWSDIARPAFMSALAIQKQRSDQTMESAIERLRASKAESNKRDELTGKADGRDWAEKHAEYDELRRIAEIEFNHGMNYFDTLYAAIDPEKELSKREFKEQIFGDEYADITEEYAEAFIEGAQGFFNEVADKL
jgi:hypothetical protein